MKIQKADCRRDLHLAGRGMCDQIMRMLVPCDVSPQVVHNLHSLLWQLCMIGMMRLAVHELSKTRAGGRRRKRGLDFQDGANHGLDRLSAMGTQVCSQAPYCVLETIIVLGALGHGVELGEWKTSKFWS